ncbi:GHKL domain-containing protein [Lachnobacterium bovis]|uniref:GHKL domain-containing protein n=1 Tax=Lachnobacterium bovis TaxID=140626 RepID=A0A1H9TM39_9FIRM|nr:GHKL domain-containing protein [Lachnobacterium bovis]SER98370.1 GHKL domain-containing protein [Lachnobacterium bovis]
MLQEKAIYRFTAVIILYVFCTIFFYMCMTEKITQEYCELGFIGILIPSLFLMNIMGIKKGLIVFIPLELVTIILMWTPFKERINFGTYGLLKYYPIIYPSVICIAGLLNYELIEFQKNRKDLLEQHNVRKKEYTLRYDEQVMLYREKNSIIQNYYSKINRHITILMNCIEQGQYDEAMEYLERVKGQIDYSEKTYSNCANQVIKGVLTLLDEKARRNKCKLFIRTLVPVQIGIEPKEIVYIMAALLENAIEASKRMYEYQEVEKDTQPVIRLYLDYDTESSTIDIKMENYCGRKVFFNDKGLPLTTKVNGGSGVKTVCHIVDKYNGKIKFIQHGKTFITRIQIKC